MPAVMTLLRRYARDLVDVFQVSHTIGSPEQPARPTIQRAWDALSVPVLLLDQDLAIGAANIAADDLLHEARYFRPPTNGDRYYLEANLALANREDVYTLEAAVNSLLRSRRSWVRVTLKGLRRSEPLICTLRRAGSKEWRRQYVPDLDETESVLALFQTEEEVNAHRLVAN